MPEDEIRRSFTPVCIDFFNVESQPAQECGGLNVPNREAVPEPNDRFPVDSFQGYFVHLTISFSPESKKPSRRKVYTPEHQVLEIMWEDVK